MPPFLSVDEAGFPRVDNVVLSLPPVVRRALALLLRNEGAVVAKESFAREVWRGGEMSDESLARCISRLRREIERLGYRLDAVYGVGYRLGAPVPETRNAEGSAAEQTERHARALLTQRRPEATMRAVALLRESIATAPSHAPSYLALAESLVTAIAWALVETEPAVDEGLAALEAARLHDASTSGLAAVRGALLDAMWRFDEADAAFAEAMSEPSPPPAGMILHARHLLMTARADEAVAQLRVALPLTPYDPGLVLLLTRALLQAGRDAEAVAEARRVVQEHPGLLFAEAFELALRAHVAPVPELEVHAGRLAEGVSPPPFAWSVLAFVLSRLGRREPAMDIIDAVLLCSRTSTGEACLYAAPLAALGEHERAAALLQRAFDERCGLLAMVLRDPANAALVAPGGAAHGLLRQVFGR